MPESEKCFYVIETHCGYLKRMKNEGDETTIAFTKSLIKALQLASLNVAKIKQQKLQESLGVKVYVKRIGLLKGDC